MNNIVDIERNNVNVVSIMHTVMLIIVNRLSCTYQLILTSDSCEEDVTWTEEACPSEHRKAG